MPPSDNDGGQNMVSNLPLLFAAGYPTSLNKISEKQLEKFIPFMVQCSTGYLQNSYVAEPEWWPKDVEFSNPFRKPKTFRGNWLEKMKEIVIICYQSHKCVFLLKFCTDLAAHEHANLRFINNNNSTTSLYSRHPNKLLVTFRNENMLYDQEQQTNRKCLLPNYNSAQANDAPDEMVEPSLFDIYLCDYCDAELYSQDAYEEHEKICSQAANTSEENEDSDDDVIFCGLEELPDPMEQQKSSFLANFRLLDKSKKYIPPKSQLSLVEGSPEKLRRLPRKSRSTLTLGKCATIPLSSPAGQFLIKTTRTVMTADYQMERLDRLERFCHAPVVSRDDDGDVRYPKWFAKGRTATVNVTYKRVGPKIHHHQFKFTGRRQFHSSALQLERLTMHEVDNKMKELRLQALLNKRGTSIKRTTPAAAAKSTHVVDVIDLCSSDEEGEFILSTDDEPQAKKLKLDCPEENNSIVQLGKEIANCGNPTPMNLGDQQLSDLLAHNNNNNNSSSNNMVNPQALRPLPSVFLFSNNIENSSSPRRLSADFCMNNQENLSAIKENRVNDWLNETSASIELPAVNQSLPIIGSSSNSMSPIPQSISPSVNAVASTTSANGKRASLPPPTISKLTNDASRPRPITANVN